MNFFQASLAPLALSAVCVVACSTASNPPAATVATKPQPVIVPVEVSVPALRSGCWVQFYSQRDFKGDMTTLVGPSSLESADKFTAQQLKRDIDSLVTGSKATLRVYEHAMFKDRSMTFGPNSARPAWSRSSASAARSSHCSWIAIEAVVPPRRRGAAP